MLKIDIKRSGNEDKYIHFCDNNNRLVKHPEIEIWVSDCHVRMYLKTSGRIEPIKCCPYCGVNPENEERPYVKPSDYENKKSRDYKKYVHSE